jgi:transposase-like protein
MSDKNGRPQGNAEALVRDIRRATRRKFSAEDKIRIVLEGLRGEDRIAELCRKEGIAQNLYYRWSKDFLEAGKKRLAGSRLRCWRSSSLAIALATSGSLAAREAEKKVEVGESVCSRFAVGIARLL